MADARGRLRGPALQCGQPLGRIGLTALGRQQGGAGAVDQQRAHVGVALPADMPQLAPLAAAELARGHAQPGTELAAIGKAFRLADRGLQGAGGQHANAADLVQFAHDLIVGMPALELLLALDHALLVQVDLSQNDMQLMTQGGQFGALDQFPGLAQEGGGSGRRFDPRLAQDAAQQVDALRAALLPGLAQAVQLLYLLLRVALHRHWMNTLAARGFEDGIAVVAVGLVAPPVGLHVARMQQGHPMPQRLGHASPVVRGAAGLHDPLDRLRLLLYISAKRLAIQPPALTHLPGTDALGNLVNGLGQIHCNLLVHR